MRRLGNGRVVAAFGVFLVVVSVVTSYLLGLSPRESDTRT